MKINDFIFRFRTDALIHKAGICRVRTFLNSCGELFVLLTELDENPSTSVTNAVERIVQQLLTQEKIPSQSKIIEHYPPAFYSSDHFDLVSFDPKGCPSWQPLSFFTIQQMLEPSEKEFENYKQDPRIQKEIQNAIQGIPKIQTFEYHEPVEIIERRLQIKANQHSMEKIHRFLDTDPSETMWSSFLKQDMSLLAECYAYPSEEYVCFAEFPVGNGRADFALFTGRSRMEVYLFEIKGSLSSIRRQNHYHEFRAEIQEGRGQLIARSDYCKKNYEPFRLFCHDVLAEVKKGGLPYHAFLGPRYQLQVDPNKDIYLHYILIAGRTRDDLADSQKRHMEDSSSSLDIRTETWDSWVNKLTRR